MSNSTVSSASGNQIVSFNPKQLQQLRKDMDEALRSVGKKYGITISADYSTYYDTECTYQLKCLINGQPTKEQRDLQIMAKRYGIDLDKEYNGNRFVSYRTRNRKYKWIVEKNGNEYKMSHHCAMMLIGSPIPHYCNVCKGLIDPKAYFPGYTTHPTCAAKISGPIQKM